MREKVLHLVAFLGDAPARSVMTGVGAALLLVAGKVREALLLVGVVGGTGAINSALKRVVQRNRPKSPFGIRQHSSSFPSGHASGAAALTGALCLILWRNTHRRLLTAIAAVLSALWIGTIDYTRVTMNKHYVGDVVGGSALGLVITLLAAVITHKVDSQAPAQEGS